jgi:ABC-type nitrate/sulfonate/bicarbonate transport system permease component
MAAAMARIDDPKPAAPVAAAGRPEDRRRGRGLSTAARIAARAFSLVLLLVAWELIARSGRVTPFMLPPLSAVVERIYGDAASGALWTNLGLTLFRAMAGFFIAMTGGIALGAAMSRLRLVRWFFDPLISIGFPMPKIAFLPIIMLWLGVYDVAKIFMVVFDAIFPVVTATLAGLAAVDRELIWSARNMGAREHELMWQIALPAALPQILTGLQVALPIALIVEIVVEMAMGGYGLGAAMLNASRFADSRGVFAGIVEIAIVGYALIKAMATIRRRLLLWHHEVQAPA